MKVNVRGPYIPEAVRFVARLSDQYETDDLSVSINLQATGATVDEARQRLQEIARSVAEELLALSK